MTRTRGSTRTVVAALLVVAAVAGYAAFAFQPHHPGASQPLPNQDALDRLHARGITGEGVDVGVLDVTGFDTGHPALAGHVAASRSFGTTGAPTRTAHGTAAAATVARVAPDADLYLASFDTPQSYRTAVRWLLGRGVDVVVAPVAFYGQPGAGGSTVTNPVDRAVAQRVTFVAPAGNLAERHWAGRYYPNESRLLFDGDSRNRLRGNRSRVSVWLTGVGLRNANFTLALYPANGSTPVARSTPYRLDAVPNEHLVATVDPDRAYDVVVTGPPGPRNIRVVVESPTHRLEQTRRAGSIVAPASDENALSVGAYDPRRGRAARFSSAGPIDGRPGVDVLGPMVVPAPAYPGGFEGTSASAAYVGGVAALVVDADPDASPARVERLLERTATDAGMPGRDPRTGNGVVNPRLAVVAARNETG